MVSAANNLTRLYLVAGGSYSERESWIATALRTLSTASSETKCGVILEGLPSGSTCIEMNTRWHVERIAPGCFCCIGNLALRVTLNRLLRQRPICVYLAINDSEHLPALQTFLSDASYLSFFQLEKVILL